MRLQLAAFAAISILYSLPALPCDSSGITVFQVVGCDDKPLAGATVDVTCKSGGTATAITDKDGNATIHVKTADIKYADVKAQVAESSRAKCSGSPCRVKLCLHTGTDTIGVTR